MEKYDKPKLLSEKEWDFVLNPMKYSFKRNKNYGYNLKHRIKKKFDDINEMCFKILFPNEQNNMTSVIQVISLYKSLGMYIKNWFPWFLED